MARTREPRRRPPTRMAQAAKAHLQYLILGLAIGGLWLLNRDKSLLYHAVQMLAVMSVFTGLQIWLRRRSGEPPAYARFIGGKLGLVALAVGAEWLLAPVTPRSNAIVAAVLVVLPTALGPTLDRLAANHATPATGADQAYPSPTRTGTSPERGTPGGVPPDPRSPNGRTPDRAWLSRAVAPRKDRSHD
jgi:hypothetical protein